MKQKINEIKTKVESKIRKFEEGVYELKRDLKKVCENNPDKVKGFMVILGLIGLRKLSRIHNRNETVSFMNRNNYHTYLNGVRINPERLTKRAEHKYQRLINKGYDVYDAATKVGLRKR